jgi:hypothetical protein
MSGCCSRRSPSSWPKGYPPNGVPQHVEADASLTVSGCGPVVLLRQRKPSSRPADRRRRLLKRTPHPCSAPRVRTRSPPHQSGWDLLARPAFRCGTPFVPLRQACAALQCALASLRPGLLKALRLRSRSPRTPQHRPPPFFPGPHRSQHTPTHPYAGPTRRRACQSWPRLRHFPRPL